MSPSNKSGRRLLSDADSATFAPPLPPEAFGWRRPGPAVLNFGGFTKSPAQIALPVPANGTKEVPAPGKASNETSTPVKTSNETSAPAKDSKEASTPANRSHASSAPVNAPHEVSAAGKGSAGVSTAASRPAGHSTSSPEPAASSQWDQLDRLPSHAMPRESPGHIIGMKDDPRSFYRYKRTQGPPIDYPSEDAGPVADRRCIDPPPITISNTYGNLRIHAVNANTVQLWYLGKTSDHKPGWVKASEGDAHPDIPGIVLSTAKKFRPHWIRDSSFDAQHTPSRVALRIERLKNSPY